jgi:AmmeMemoRadiSam system protein B
MAIIRPPAVADMFYPGDPARLSRMLQQMLDDVEPQAFRPKAVIAPHAGYIYSGPIAASAYALLKPLRDVVRRVVLIGPVHRVWVRGLALPAADLFETPLGEVPLDIHAMAELQRFPQVEVSPAAHAAEHSLEVQLPFLQTLLKRFKLVPLAVGGASAHEVAEVLEAIWGGEETLIVVSSDLSHYHPYDEARQLDQETIQAILDGRTNLVGEQACGAHGINGLLLAARHKGLQPHLLDLRNSGDTAGDHRQVVGYAALAFTEKPHAH